MMAQNPTILIVDDEAYIRLLIQQALEDLEDQGVRILTAANGEEALQVVQTEQPALVFLDVMMPRLNGFDICQMIKGQLKLKNVYIVMLTAKGQEIDKQRGQMVAADQYITKPFDPDELLALAGRVLEIAL